jgi:acyl carrier protein
MKSGIPELLNRRRCGANKSRIRNFVMAEFRGLIQENYRVTDEGHFADDLGADWLDRLELMIVIEDQFAHVVITDEHVDQIEVVGDLIRRIKNVD